MELKIREINADSPVFTTVLRLARANSASLGYLPRGAFRNSASRGELLGAFDKRGKFFGYLLYSLNHRARLAYIVQVCVKHELRQRGVARALIDELKKRTRKDFRGIRVRCRRDFEASEVWPRMGFAALSEMAGRSKYGSVLTVWWFDHGHPTLFSIDDKRTQACIDANVFFDLENPLTIRSRESVALQSDWLKDAVELCVTPELYNEIDRNDDRLLRTQCKQFASTFTTLWCPSAESQEIYERLLTLFPKSLSRREESDCRQLASTIGAGVKFFVTRDSKLLRAATEVYRLFGIQVLRPSVLITNQDTLAREEEYQPARLEGSHLNVGRVRNEDVSVLEDIFRAPQQETKADLRDRLHPLLAEPRSYESKIVQVQDEPIALMILGRENDVNLTVHVLRLRAHSLAPTLARHLLCHAVLISSSEGRTFTVVQEPYLSANLCEALLEMGFMSAQGTWIKANPAVVEERKNLVDLLLDRSRRIQRGQSRIVSLSTSLARAKSESELIRLERILWPAKITDLDIPSFVIPIKPQWALQLFDREIAGQDLFGSEPSLVLQLENVYYRSATQRILSAPARVLWYVSKGESKYQGAMAIRACSYLDEVAVDKPKSLFSRFRRLGVYRWPDLVRLTRSEPSRDIMAFRFSNTELFPSPITYTTVRRIWKQGMNCNFHPQGPIRMPGPLFFQLYELGCRNKS